MQQEYTPYGPEWAKEIKKLTKDQIIDNLLRPALLKANAEPGQSAGTWVKASERTPDNDDVQHVKIDGVKHMGHFFHDYAETRDTCFYVQSNGARDGWVIERSKFDGICWLDESASPGNKKREIAFGVWLMENTVAQYENKKLHSFRLFGPYTDNIDYTPQEVYAYWESINKTT